MQIKGNMQRPLNEISEWKPKDGRAVTSTHIPASSIKFSQIKRVLSGKDARRRMNQTFNNKALA